MSTYSTWNSDSGNIRNLAEELADQHAMAMAREAALNRRLRSLEGDMQNRVQSLGSLVNALIELSDVRDELTLFTQTRKAREAARALTRAVTIGDGDISFLRQSPDLEDIAGYWLIPAAVAIADVRNGVIDHEAVTAAITRDPLRAATYLVGVCVAAGRSSLATPWLSLALPAAAASTPSGATAVGTPGQASYDITVAERALWAACEAEIFTDPAPIRAFLAARLDGLGPNGLATLGTDLYANPPQPFAAPATEADPVRWAEPGTQRASVGTIVKDLESLTAIERWARSASAAPALANSAEFGSPDGAAATQSLLTAVLSLVDEGAPGERDLIRRVDVLNSTLGRPGVINRWDSDAGPLVPELVKAARSSRPWAAHLVAPVISSGLAATASARVRDALAGPAPSRTFNAAAVRIVISPTDDGEVAAANARERIIAGPQRRFSGAAILGSAGALFATLLLGIFAAPGWFVVSAIVAVGAGIFWLVSERNYREELTYAANAVGTLNAELASQRAQVVADVESDRLRRAEVSALDQRVQAALLGLSA